MTNLSWKRMPNGDRQANEHPIRLQKPLSRRSGSAGWLVRVPYERDRNFEDGWMWTNVGNPTYNSRGGTYLEGSDYNDARAVVAEHLSFILTQIPPDWYEDQSLPAPQPEPAPDTKPERTGQPAYQQIAEDYRAQITGGALKPGDQLPSEPELMAAYGVSRIVVRQALDGLKAEGLIVKQQGLGSFVAPAATLEDTSGWRCGCGCGTSVAQSSVYAPGHDARHRDQLVDLLVGRGSVRERATRISHLISGLKGRAS